MRKEELTQEELKQLIEYDSETGIFYSLKRNKKKPVGHIIEGHIGIDINSYKYMAQRLAFLYMEGYFPENKIIHINGIKIDNRWNNLKEATHKCVIQCALGNKLVRGVSWREKIKRYVVNLKNNDKLIQLRFKTFNEAVKKRYELEQKYFTCGCEQSSAYKYLKENNLL